MGSMFKVLAISEPRLTDIVGFKEEQEEAKPDSKAATP